MNAVPTTETTRPRRYGARELIELVLDPGSFTSWDRPADPGEIDPEYAASLQRARARSGEDESVLTGRGAVDGRPVAVMVGEFSFLGGSIGRVAAQRLVDAVRRATAEGLPLLASTASGGTRMQEGTPAFVEMVSISRAIMEHRRAGLPYLVHLRHPTTGGVFASWGSLGHVTVAEPGALVGFLGPSVYEGLHGEPFPEGVQQSENLARHGVIDRVVATEDLRTLVGLALGVLTDPAGEPRLERPQSPAQPPTDPWEAIQATRRADRMGVRGLLEHAASGTLTLRGTKRGELDDSILVALTRLDGMPCVVIGQDRSRQTPTSAMGPAALRQAHRAMNLAEEMGLPVVTVIDTPGAELSQEAEERAMAGEIARCIGRLATLSVPTLAVVLGQGCGGGALALMAADEVLALENAWLSPLPPEGASLIVHGDVEHAAEMARRQQVGAGAMLEAGLVHGVVPEASLSEEELARGLAAEVVARLGVRSGRG
ncbi:acetyl-CoA carboxylase carboxyl transferase subunit beta [Kytococcus aerolatus]|uniref:Acetyl-CoA carboxylase carboxyl transferase subunit beta n=1 Tax=Kytococcus aerolatus TaxID=592308 RepID=A0A212U529_9MICO|nr:carboxyl transferase domain-containing protein [Kytococcus aerolatus]SNC73296.1 acetyl-CoA carboxylase carboxyl transferase subunit beta [Kytococcus aerolatus]